MLPGIITLAALLSDWAGRCTSRTADCLFPVERYPKIWTATSLYPAFVFVVVNSCPPDVRSAILAGSSRPLRDQIHISFAAT